MAGGPGGRVPPFAKGTGGAASLLHVQALPKPLCLAQVTEVGKKNKHFFKKINVCFRKKIMIVSKNEKNYLCLAHVAAHCLHHTTPREKPSPQRRTAVLQSDALLVNSKD